MNSKTKHFRFLAPFDYDSLPEWNFLTQFITARRVNSIMPECGLVRSSAEYESCPDADRPKGGDPNASAVVRHLNNKLLQNEDFLLPNLQVIPGTAIRFTALPDRYPVGATPSQITQCFMDCFASIAELLNRYQHAMGLIDECQIAFVLFHFGCSVDALTQWRKILNLLANSQQATERFVEFYSTYLDVIDHQLPLLPEEIIAPSKFNSVYKDVQQLVRNCGSIADLRSKVKVLTSSLEKTLNWTFNIDDYDDDPEDLPVVVEI